MFTQFPLALLRWVRQAFSMAAVEIDVKYVAHLARLALSPEEEQRIGAQLNHILAYIEKLNELDVTGVEPMTSVTPMRLPRRADGVTDGGYPAQILANAPDAREGFFAVPKVVE